jgi:hypothetical protein
MNEVLRGYQNICCMWKLNRSEWPIRRRLTRPVLVHGWSAVASAELWQGAMMEVLREITGCGSAEKFIPLLCETNLWNYAPDVCETRFIHEHYKCNEYAQAVG